MAFALSEVMISRSYSWWLTLLCNTRFPSFPVIRPSTSDSGWMKVKSRCRRFVSSEPTAWKSASAGTYSPQGR